MLTALVLGAVIGLILGLTGAGGGSLAVPALVFGLGLSIPQATPIALLAVAGSALLGTVEGFRRRLVRYRAASLMALTGMAATPLGVLVAHRLPERILLGLSATVLGIVAARALGWGQVDDAPPGPVACQLDPTTGQLRWDGGVAAVLAAIGAATGLLSGLLGVGGGFVIVPALRRVSDIPLAGIVATSLMVMCIVSLAALVAAVAHGATLSVTVAGPFVGATALGMVAGRLAARRVASHHVHRLFGLVLLVVALSLLVKALTSPT
ncbi:MAG: sulfite exporter TauE/SafE family protein [Zoogloeaceae bacterium]|nr:sulfite exporter TauE/SafE family protein [Zoogloeaceae bacterium]